MYGEYTSAVTTFRLLDHIPVCKGQKSQAHHHCTNRLSVEQHQAWYHYRKDRKAAHYSLQTDKCLKHKKSKGPTTYQDEKLISETLFAKRNRILQFTRMRRDWKIKKTRSIFLKGMLNAFRRDVNTLLPWWMSRSARRMLHGSFRILLRFFLPASASNRGTWELDW